MLDEELDAWRTRPLGEVKYLVLEARYEKMRHGGVVRDAAVLSAIGVGPDERRRVLGVSVALSEAEVHWRGFLESLVARGLRGVAFNSSDDHAGLRTARRAVLGGAASSIWPKTPSTTRQASRSASASAPSCAPYGTQARWPPGALPRSLPDGRDSSMPWRRNKGSGQWSGARFFLSAAC